MPSRKKRPIHFWSTADGNEPAWVTDLPPEARRKLGLEKVRFVKDIEGPKATLALDGRLTIPIAVRDKFGSVVVVALTEPAPTPELWLLPWHAAKVILAKRREVTAPDAWAEWMRQRPNRIHPLKAMEDSEEVALDEDGRLIVPKWMRAEFSSTRVRLVYWPKQMNTDKRSPHCNVLAGIHVRSLKHGRP